MRCSEYVHVQLDSQERLSHGLHAEKLCWPSVLFDDCKCTLQPLLRLISSLVMALSESEGPDASDRRRRFACRCANSPYHPLLFVLQPRLDQAVGGRTRISHLRNPICRKVVLCWYEGHMIIHGRKIIVRFASFRCIQRCGCISVGQWEWEKIMSVRPVRYSNLEAKTQSWPWREFVCCLQFWRVSCWREANDVHAIWREYTELDGFGNLIEPTRSECGGGGLVWILVCGPSTSMLGPDALTLSNIAFCGRPLPEGIDSWWNLIEPKISPLRVLIGQASTIHMAQEACWPVSCLQGSWQVSSKCIAYHSLTWNVGRHIVDATI